MTRSGYAVETLSSLRQPARFRGIDGHDLAQQYVLNRELGSYRQGSEWHYSGKRRGAADGAILPSAPDDLPYGRRERAVRPDGGGMLRRIAIWLSKVGAV